MSTKLRWKVIKVEKDDNAPADTQDYPSSVETALNDYSTNHIDNNESVNQFSIVESKHHINILLQIEMP